MRSSIGRMLVALVAVCALGAVTTASALATPKWYENGIAITESKSVKSEFTKWEFEDKTPLGGTNSTRVKCSAASKGTVAQEGKGTTTELTLTGCTFVKAGVCEHKEGETPKVTATGLPWKTQLIEVGIEVRNKIEAGAGIQIECKAPLVGTIKDVCKANPVVETAGLTNEVGGVKEIYNEPTLPPFNCKIGSETTREAGVPSFFSIVSLTAGAKLSFK
jgi:hypothetical protein